MPGHIATGGKYEPAVRQLLDFLSSLPARLSSVSEDAALPSELQSHITSLRVSANAVATVSSKENLDGKATEIWNLVTRINRQKQKFPAGQNKLFCNERDQHSARSKPDLLASVRVLALMLLDCANRNRRNVGRPKWKESVRLMKVALKTAKSCLDCARLELCTKVMEKAADYEAAMGHIGKETNDQIEVEESDEEKDVYRKLKLEYWALRIILAWKQERLDLAENMYQHVELDEVTGDHGLQEQDIETIADLLYEIGKDLFRKQEYSQAVKWLERSLDTVSAHDLTRMSPDIAELKSSITNYLVRALLAPKTDEGRVRADNLIVLLENDHGEKMFVSLLRLEYLASQPSFDSERYYTVLARMMRTVHLTESNFKTIMKHVHVLKEQSTINACKALDDLLILRLLADSQEDWLEKAFVTRLWLGTDMMAGNLGGDLEALQRVMAGIAAKLTKPLTAPATHASQVLIWKRVNFEYDHGRYDLAQAWSRLSTDELLSRGGNLNTATIARKLMMCALAKQDLAEARSIFNQMPKEAREAPMTRYLMYKVALRDQDSMLAAECLDLIGRDSAKDTTLLYACVLEAQQCGNKQQALTALQLVLTKFNYSAPTGVHVPALIRCTARLLVSELSVGGIGLADISAQITDLFQGAMHAAGKLVPKDGSVSEVFTETEFKWFARNSYNLAIKYYGEWPPEDSARLLETCIFFVEKLSNSWSLSGIDTAASQYRVAFVLITQTFVKLARISESHEIQLQYYLQVRKYVKQYLTQQLPFQGQIENREEVDEMARRMVKNDFEAVIHLKKWDDLCKILEASGVFQNKQLYEILADMLLASDAPPAIMLSNLEHLITASSSLTSPTISKLARWLRIGYTLSLQHASTQTIEYRTYSSSTKTELILSHALNIARLSFASTGSKQDPTPDMYPPEELEYLATTTFNRAIDSFCAGDEEECRRLGQRALEAADVLSNVDKGELKQCLVERLASLGCET